MQNKIDGFIEEATQEERKYLTELTLMHQTVLHLQAERKALMKWMADNLDGGGASRHVAADVLSALALARATEWSAKYDMKLDAFIDMLTADDDKA